MATTTPRSRAPPYPRPVSPIEADEIPLCPGIIVYNNDRDNTEEEAAKRAAKRRKRITDNAEAYLRGEQLYIMTASLKGPFDRGWKNPWKKSRTEKPANTPREVPETTAQSRLTRPVRHTTIPESTWRRRVDDRTELAAVVDNIEFTQPAVVKQKAHTNVFRKTQDLPDPTRAHLTPTSARRIEDWLRTSDAYKTDRLPDVRSSPTPDHRETLITPNASARRPMSVGANKHETKVGAWADRFSSRQDLEQLPSQQAVPEPSTQQTHESPNRAEVAIMAQKARSVHKVPPSTNLPAFEYKRAKRPLAELSSPARQQNNEKKAKLEATNTIKEGAKPVRDAEMKESEPLKPAKPGLSTETSKATTLNHMASAQIVSAVAPPEGFSNVQSTADLLELVRAPTERTTQAQDQLSTEPHHVLAAHTSQPNSPTRDAAQLEGAQPDEPEPQAMTTETIPQTPARKHLDTQALLGSIKPFDISTIKKIEIPPMEVATPVTATKASPKKKPAARGTKAKKASFANDPSSDENQASIKYGFQVRKQPASSPFATTTKDAITEDIDRGDDDGDLDPPTAAHDRTPTFAADALATKPTSFPAVNKPLTTTNPPPRKSILKTRSQPACPPALTSSIPAGTTQTAGTGLSVPSNTNGTYQSTSGSPKQDAQRPEDELDMFAIEKGSAGGGVKDGGGGGGGGGGADADGSALEMQQFDMDAVIEDLGSYLGGSWDVERAVMRAG